MEFLYYLLGFLLIPALILAIWAEVKVHNVYAKYKKVNVQSGRTAGETTRAILDAAGLQNVQIKTVKGTLTDYYDSRNKLLAISDDSYDSSSISSIGVAAHETGHALQDKEGYFPLKLRHLIIKTSNLISKSLIPLIIIGFIGLFIPFIGGTGVLIYMCALGGFYFLAMILSLITLPVEFNASRRAIQILRDSGTLTEEELKGAKKVLSAAALTYIASFLYSLIYFLRIVVWVLSIISDN